MEIHQHALAGNDISHRDTPNKSGEIVPRYLVFHYTAGYSAESSIEHLCRPEARASAHIVVGREGDITQLASFNIKTWHAGISQWNGLNGMNNYSIGIEMDNAGPLNKVGNDYFAWFGKSYPEEQAMYVRHKHEDVKRYWHTFTEIQISKALALAELLVNEYKLEDIIGHDDIARGRKSDPGPAFPLPSIRNKALGRSEDEPPHYLVTASALNVRSGPGVEFETVSAPIKRDTEVILLKAGDRWNRIEVLVDEDIEGWVHNQYIKRIVAS